MSGLYFRELSGLTQDCVLVCGSVGVFRVERYGKRARSVVGYM